MPNIGHEAGPIHRAWGALTPGEWGAMAREADALGLRHNGELTCDRCPRCKFMDARAASVLVARGVTVEEATT